MRLRNLGAACAACAVAASSSPADARYSATAVSTRTTEVAPGDMRRAAKRLLIERHMFLVRRLGHVRGESLSLAERRRKRVGLHGLDLPALHRSNRRLLVTVRRARVTGSAGAPAATTAPQVAPNGALPPQLAAIAQCESGGNPRAVSAGGTYRGKYQFSFSTWASVGGSGDPAAASEAEQDLRAAILYRRAGPAPWPVCGR